MHKIFTCISNTPWKEGIDRYDKVIIQFAEICKQIFPEDCLIGRWGGEEFVAVLSNITLNKVKQLSEQIVRLEKHLKID